MNFSQEQKVNQQFVLRFEQALANLPEPFKDTFTNFFINRPLAQWRHIKAEELAECAQQLDVDINTLTLALLPVAAAYAYTPISEFNVGAMVIDENDDLYFGANFEFLHTHMAQTIHAEQSAITHAWMSGAGALKRLIVNYPPCGHCRQFINETKRLTDFQIQLPDRQAQSFDYYLPESFGPDDLAVSERILQSQASNTEHSVPAQILESMDPLVKKAYEAFLRSHSPYSHSESGIAIEYDDGEIVSGSYGENAAFNPSIPPLQVALNYRRMLGKTWHVGIKRAYLLEEKSQLSQRENTECLLRTLADCTLEYQSIDQ